MKQPMRPSCPWPKLAVATNVRSGCFEESNHVEIAKRHTLQTNPAMSHCQDLGQIRLSAHGLTKSAHPVHHPMQNTNQQRHEETTNNHNNRENTTLHNAHHGQQQLMMLGALRIMIKYPSGRP